MSSKISLREPRRTEAPREPEVSAPSRKRRGAQPGSSLLAHGEPMIWLTGGALAICLLMIASLLILILVQGLSTFWPAPLVQISTTAGEQRLGEVTRTESFRAPEDFVKKLPQASRKKVGTELRGNEGYLQRRLIRTGNFELSNSHFHWVTDALIAKETLPRWAVVLEREEWGRFYGTPRAFELDGKSVAQGPQAAWRRFNQYHDQVRERWTARQHIERYQIGEIGRRQEQARLAVVQAALDYGKDSPEQIAAQREYARIEGWSDTQSEKLAQRVRAMNRENARYQLVMRTADGEETRLPLDEIVRAYPANQLSLSGKLGVYFSRWKEFLSDEPRAANSEGGVFPAIFGTVVMTLLMSLAVVPFGVLAALYLREYAKAGTIVSAVRIAINNLAGIPSIVFGVFGLGFFCYTLGGAIDSTFFEAKLPRPTFGTGGLMWASLTLALLTLPVVIVATEEALSAVPNSMREGSYACGASKWQTIWRIVLPRAMPGIMTGMILAMARGAGEVAPLMLVGAVKLAPELSVDGTAPFVHPERSFMHLGFHIFDVGFQSQNSEAARPMVFTTTLLLIAIIAALNITAVWLRSRLRRRFTSSQF